MLVACDTHGCHASPKPVAVVAPKPPPRDDARLAAALKDKGPDYVPRTRHKRPDGTPLYTNRLILEASPYLQQHAHNPVDWYPWGDEAFAAARMLGRPVFLSVGYATCHWCHVMEEESFEDEAIATYLNEHYVAIKVDREERPDVDAVYMSFVQSMVGSGGWPMNVWLTDAREPFFGGTYFPPRAGMRGAKRGLSELLAEQATRLRNDRGGVVADAKDFVQRLQKISAPEPAGDLPGRAVLRAARADAARRFDPDNGGSRGAPKFPSSFPVQTLLRVARREHDEDARKMAIETVRAIDRGGIHDVVGGGFHRYATDARWRVPHFEKTLYDNALLAIANLEAYQASGEIFFADVARETLDYLVRELEVRQGGFISGTDADSLGANGRREEGVFFTWTPAELSAVLGPADAKIAALAYGVTAEGSLEGRSVLRTERTAPELAKKLGRPVEEITVSLAEIRARLYAARAKRPPPLRDDKIIVSWNALAISALARGALSIGGTGYERAATEGARRLLAPLRAKRPLPHLMLAPNAETQLGFAEDHAALAAACLDLFELRADPDDLRLAEELMETLEAKFVDETNGGYFLTAKAKSDGPADLFLREKPTRDGPTPTASSTAALVWYRLYAFTGDERHRARGEVTIRAVAKTLSTHPLSLEHTLLALDWVRDTPKEIVLVLPFGSGVAAAEAAPFREALAKVFVPNRSIVVAEEGRLAVVGARVPWAKEKKLRGGKATAYVCERGVCQLPTTDVKTFVSQVTEVRP